MTDSAGHDAGLVSNALAVQAFCNVVSLLGRFFGSSTLTLLMLACVPIEPEGYDSFTFREAPAALEVWEEVEALNFGSNLRLEQLARLNGPRENEAGLTQATQLCWVVTPALLLAGRCVVRPDCCYSA